MQTFLIITQIVLSVLITVLIFLQAPADSDGRSNLMSTVNFEKRGWEKVMFNFTIIILIAFIASSLIQLTI